MGVISRPIILTVPALCRTPLDQNAAVVLSAFRRCGAQGLEDCYSPVRGKALRGGSSTVLHTHGRHGHSPPPRHRLATSGGYAAQGARWEPLPYLPYDLLRRQWPWHLLTMRRHTRKTEAIHPWVAACFRTSPNGRVTNGQQGTVPAPSQSLARDVAQDVGSPPIAVRRIAPSDGQRVPYHDRSHRTDRMEHATVAVATCIGRMGQHTVPKGFTRSRSDGVPATKTFAKVQGMLHAALAKVEGIIKGAVPISARFTSRQRYEPSTGRDPLVCPHCPHEMGVWRLWHPTDGVIYDEGEVMKRGTYASTGPRAGP